MALNAIRRMFSGGATSHSGATAFGGAISTSTQGGVGSCKVVWTSTSISGIELAERQARRSSSTASARPSIRISHLPFHCVLINGVFDSAADGVVFHAASDLDANAVAQVQQSLRQRLLRGFERRGLLPEDDAQVMAAWAHGGGFFVDEPSAHRPGRVEDERANDCTH